MASRRPGPPIRRYRFETYPGLPGLLLRLVYVSPLTGTRAYVDQVIDWASLEYAYGDVEELTWRRMARTMGLRWGDVWLTKVSRG